MFFFLLFFKEFSLFSQSKILNLREENDLLREQLKELCNLLTKELEKKKLKKTNPNAEAEDPDSKNLYFNEKFSIIKEIKLFLEKTIENNDKQIKYYKKMLGKMQNKEESNTAPPQK